MSSEYKDKTPLKVVKLDKAQKLAEAWVNNMSTSTSDEQSVVEFEGRPARLGLGAKIAPKVKATIPTDAAERKLLGKLHSKKKLSEDVEKTSSVKESSADDENEPESRTSAFVKKRPMPPTPPFQAKKERK